MHKPELLSMGVCFLQHCEWDGKRSVRAGVPQNPYCHRIICFHVFQVASEEFGGLPTVFPERRQIKEEADQSMEWGEDPLGMEQQDPESIVPDQDHDEEEEAGDISQESEEDSDDEQLAKPTPSKLVKSNYSSDSDSGVDDPTPLTKGGLYQMLSEAVQRNKKEARTRKEEKWAMEDDDDEQGEEGAGKGQKYKELAKVEQSCGIRELYTIPEKNVIGPRLHAICRHILNTNILVSPLNQEYTENSHGHHSLVVGAWRSQLEERYKMKSGFWREDEDKLLRSRCDELVGEGLCDNGNDLADLINSQTGSAKSRRPKKGSRDPSARNVVGLYLGMDLPHRTAFECSQRLVQLVKGVSVLSKKDKELSEARAKVKQENPTPRKQKMMWTHDEDRTLMELVLRKKSGGYKTVEKADGRPEGSRKVLKIPWETLSKEFENRRWGDLRDRWQVHLKPVLQQPDLWETTEAIVGLDLDLLLAVAETGATSLGEVPWDMVMQDVPGHLPAFLKNRLRGLTRQPSETATNLNEKVSQILDNMRQGRTLKGTDKRKGIREQKLRKAQERNADLIQHYQFLISRNPGRGEEDANV